MPTPQLRPVTQCTSDASDRDMIAAVHGYMLSSDVGCAIGQQKTYRLDCLIRRGPTPHRNPRQYAVPKLVAPDRFGHGRLDNPETDGVGPHAEFRPFPGGRHRHAKQAALGRSVVDLPDRATPSG